jgi:hypothetical protein
MGYPGSAGSHLFLRNFCNDFGGGETANSENWVVDPLVIVIVIVVGMPLAVIWALAKSARLRGQAPRNEPRRRVAALVTDAIPAEHPDEPDPDVSGPDYTVDSAAPEPDPDVRER